MKEMIKRHGGIYGIYIDDELVYIGKTTRNFEDRFQQHKYLLLHPEKDAGCMILYDGLRDAKEHGHHVWMAPIVDLSKIQYISMISINNRDIECMEMALIEEHKPRLNVCGISKPYKFDI